MPDLALQTLTRTSALLPMPLDRAPNLHGWRFQCVEDASVSLAALQRLSSFESISPLPPPFTVHSSLW